ncbi:unnamed protein product [Orchesella dallaii]|uniref:Uncharacterized protein n=1 Tax=Orchesella dallaii TaxID=48710 RepID=A0ABP1QVY4_9HEXA
MTENMDLGNQILNENGESSEEFDSADEKSENGETEVEIRPDKAFRINKFNADKIRNIKVKFSTISSRDIIFQNRDNAPDPISIKPDIPFTIRRDHAVLKKKEFELKQMGQDCSVNMKTRQMLSNGVTFNVIDGILKPVNETPTPVPGPSTSANSGSTRQPAVKRSRTEPTRNFLGVETTQRGATRQRKVLVKPISQTVSDNSKALWKQSKASYRAYEKWPCETTRRLMLLHKKQAKHRFDCDAQHQFTNMSNESNIWSAVRKLCPLKMDHKNSLCIDPDILNEYYVGISTKTDNYTLPDKPPEINANGILFELKEFHKEPTNDKQKEFFRVARLRLKLVPDTFITKIQDDMRKKAIRHPK